MTSAPEASSPVAIPGLAVWLIAYDIVNDGVRNAAASLLMSYGDRIQKSVYIVRATRVRMDMIMDALTALVRHSTDAVHVIPLCSKCAAETVAIGQATIPPQELCWLAL